MGGAAAINRAVADYASSVDDAGRVGVCGAISRVCLQSGRRRCCLVYRPDQHGAGRDLRTRALAALRQSGNSLCTESASEREHILLLEPGGPGRPLLHHRIPHRVRLRTCSLSAELAQPPRLQLPARFASFYCTTSLGTNLCLLQGVKLLSILIALAVVVFSASSTAPM